MLLQTMKIHDSANRNSSRKLALCSPQCCLIYSCPLAPQLRIKACSCWITSCKTFFTKTPKATWPNRATCRTSNDDGVRFWSFRTAWPGERGPLHGLCLALSRSCYTTTFKKSKPTPAVVGSPDRTTNPICLWFRRNGGMGAYNSPINHAFNRKP